MDGAPDLLRQLWEVSHALRAMSGQMERRIGISGLQRLVLREVAGRPGVGTSELANALALPVGTVTGIVERLVYRALLVREPRDEPRTVRLQITPAGRHLLETRGLTIERVVARAVADLDPETRDAGSRLLEALGSALRDAAGPGPIPDPSDGP